MAGAGIGDPFRAMMEAFRSRTHELREMACLPKAGNFMEELASLNTSVQAIESQLCAIKERLKEENEALPKAKALIDASIRQQRHLQEIVARLPPNLPGVLLQQEARAAQQSLSTRSSHSEGGPGGLEEGTARPGPSAQEKKIRGPPPRHFVTAEELASLSSYMRGRLTLDKINAAVDELAVFAEANAKLLLSSRKKSQLGEDALNRLLELKEIAAVEGIKGRYFILENDLRGCTAMKMDNTGKAILTVLRHLGRISEVRTRSQRVIVLSKP